jgi:hypothetical protein
VAEKHIIHATGMKKVRIGGETLLKPLLVAPSTPSIPSPAATK